MCGDNRVETARGPVRGVDNSDGVVVSLSCDQMYRLVNAQISYERDVPKPAAAEAVYS